MSTYSRAQQFNDPRYQKALEHFQRGEWQSGLAELEQLAHEYPASQEIRSLQREMKLRGQIDDYEQVDIRQDKRRRTLKWGVRLAIFAVMLGLSFWAVKTYSDWMQQRLLATRQIFEGQISNVEIAAKLRDGQNLLQAGDAGEALAMFKEVAEKNPNISGLDEYIQKAENLQTLEAKYDEAIRLTNLDDLNGALLVLEEIDAAEPYYRDVPLRVEQIKSQFLLGDIMAEAETAFQNSNWEEAASKYETVRAIDPDYKAEFIEDRLFNSYMNVASTALDTQSDSADNLEIAENYFRKALALRPRDKQVLDRREQIRAEFRDSLSKTYVEAARQAINDQADSLQALKIAEEYFRKALALRPGDPEILRQRELAFRFLRAQNSYDSGDWDSAIADLEYIYGEDSTYALGTARQTLYEAYMARGKNYSAGGEYMPALDDFRRAIVIAEDSDQFVLASYLARINIAETQGLMGDYEDAVFTYQDAINSIDLDKNALEENAADTLKKLETAERYANLRYFRTAYRYFQQAAPNIISAETLTTHIVQSGEYLNMLASRYHTTTEAILQLNNLGSPKQVQAGQELIIPGVTP